MHRRALVAGHASHFQFGVVRISGNEIIVAKELVADARTVAGGTRLFDRRILARAVSCQESAASEGRATDVALSTGAVTFGAVVVERFLNDRRIDIRANCFQVRPIAVLVDVQTGLVMLGLLSVTERARFFRILARFGDEVFVRGGLVGGRAIPVVAKDTTEFAVCGLNELGVATEKNFFPRFQRGDRAASPFPLGLCRFFDLVDREFLQRFLVAMAFGTTIACRNRSGRRCGGRFGDGRGCGCWNRRRRRARDQRERDEHCQSPAN